jgi:4-diphosphocytidyl-2-C-methyl-D-erythritol kinase
MIAFANAKINLGLYITSKRPDGYHSIESIFLPISLSDVIEVVPSEQPGIFFKTDGISVDGNAENNLCVKAYNLLKEEFGIPSVEAFLLKNIPIGAGLGGGSSDAAFMLKSLNSLFELNLSPDELKARAAMLGSDCPFFIDNTSAFVSGRGEVMEVVETGLDGMPIIVVHPGIHISTVEAYRNIYPQAAPHHLKEILKQPIEEWQQHVRNDFESFMIDRFPEIGLIKSELIKAGALYASMSGSGSAVYGIFNSHVEIPQSLKKYFSVNAAIGQLY